MKFITPFITSLLLSVAAAAVVDSPSAERQVRYRGVERDVVDSESYSEELWKRRGGGGGGGGRGGGGGGGSRGGSSGGGSRGGSGGGSGRGTNTQGNSNRGGYSRDGTGPQPGFVGGTYYAGGSKVPYPAGGSPPGRTLTNYPIGYGGLAFYPGYWPPYGAYYYPYSYNHHYYNRTSKKDEVREIICVCAKYSVCACDDIDNEEFYDELIDDGDWEDLNKTMVNVAEVNGTRKIVINGTLPNGTTIPTDDEDLYEMYLNGAASIARALGLWPAVAAVAATVLLT